MSSGAPRLQTKLPPRPLAAVQRAVPIPPRTWARPVFFGLLGRGSCGAVSGCCGEGREQFRRCEADCFRDPSSVRPRVHRQLAPALPVAPCRRRHLSLSRRLVLTHGAVLPSGPQPLPDYLPKVRVLSHDPYLTLRNGFLSRVCGQRKVTLDTRSITEYTLRQTTGEAIAMDTKAVEEGKVTAGGRKLNLTQLLRKGPRTQTKGGARRGVNTLTRGR